MARKLHPYSTWWPVDDFQRQLGEEIIHILDVARHCQVPKVPPEGRISRQLSGDRALVSHPSGRAQFEASYSNVRGTTIRDGHSGSQVSVNTKWHTITHRLSFSVPYIRLPWTSRVHRHPRLRSSVSWLEFMGVAKPAQQNITEHTEYSYCSQNCSYITNYIFFYKVCRFNFYKLDFIFWLGKMVWRWVVLMSYSVEWDFIHKNGFLHFINGYSLITERIT